MPCLNKVKIEISIRNLYNMLSYVLQPDILTQNHINLSKLYTKNKSLPILTFTLVPQLFTTDNHALKVLRHLHMMMVLLIYSDLMKMPNGKKKKTVPFTFDWLKKCCCSFLLYLSNLYIVSKEVPNV